MTELDNDNFMMDDELVGQSALSSPMQPKKREQDQLSLPSDQGRSSRTAEQHNLPPNQIWVAIAAVYGFRTAPRLWE
eukprot:4897373-Amphidinium_carterae.2